MEVYDLLTDSTSAENGTALNCATTPFAEDFTVQALFEFSNFAGVVKLQTSDDGGSTWSDTISITKTAEGLVHSVTTVDSSAGGTAQTTNCTNVPAKSVITNVMAEVVTPMDGDTTTTLEVGVSGNADAYIDTVDFDPSAAAGTAKGSASGTTNDVKYAQFVAAATQVIATWTNTANMTTGSTSVTVSYFTPGVTGGPSTEIREITLGSYVRAITSSVTAGSVSVKISASG